MNFNRVFLVGKVTREIEVRKTKSGLSVGEFRLMTTHTKKNGDQEECGIDVTVWGDDADKWSEKLNNKTDLEKLQERVTKEFK